MEHRIGFVDVGARGGTAPRLGRILDKLYRVLVEPEPTEAARLQAASENGSLYTVIPQALAHTDGTINLHVTVNPYCTSALRVNQDLIGHYGIQTQFAFKETLQVTCSRYDTLFAEGKLPRPHVLKIDVQGFEYQVLQGFGRLLHDCLTLELETHFYPIYQDQRLFAEVVRFLSSYDFVLRRLSNSRSPNLRGDRHFDGDLVEVDATFSKTRRWVLSQSSSVRSDFRLASEVLDIDQYWGS